MRSKSIRPEIYISDIEDCEYKDDILKLYEAGIFNLFPDGTFKPNDYMKKTEFAVITVRVAEALSIDLSKFYTLPSDLRGSCFEPGYNVQFGTEQGFG